MNLRGVNINYCRLVVFIRHDSAEIWSFKYGLALAIGTIKIITGTGVFVCVVCALKHSTSGHGRQKKHKLSRSYQKNDLSKEFHQGRQRTKQTERQPRIMVDLIQLNT
jgi:hypothetical protein